ncbi:dol-P-Glc:Glc(2)Man(9)GlcNAc(2)-PP-Dol alpha-1,2-glucosyltransferase-like [Selaginella moellendorffii]|uniref:dol-P-Glc:Glc(2)Man(9)GlcNAc(2)-PP-Dol alpha-1,2-glucosyltransferase-like n=1 Tax=Selaginella moellendorffii TaxID=88036 RepID=UPI000D1C8ABC|nr:dol-P-Glc:Glc(2)Man(9)GlcNAc(2)-PP-Dol alpha-1,2-glucosyltransferase-like [Selaginella moellendorffii]|eukprot:XP_024538006.1 dol-P-Glc:Glc(2)Man(9)GlcNAc(2)-PP-Dol alpha-1,2-glucosyltransferase-like [Selaginella moellendorffii]
MSILVLIATLLAFALPVAYLVNGIVPDPYMDEIFHVPQAQRYCKRDFYTWDPMITTLPGLYLVSLVFESMVSWIPGMDLCTLNALRSINILLSLVCVCLFRSILLHLDPKVSEKALLLKSVVLALYPLHWFFTFLYYTDVGSTAAVMAMYLACLKRSYWISATLSILAIMFRQTNAVWTVFGLCVGVIQFLQEGISSSKEEEAVDDTEKTPDKRYSESKFLRRRRVRRTAETKHATHFTGRHSDLQDAILNAWQRKWFAARQFSPFVLVILAFLAFVVYNGSIVVGAKDAHRASPHFAQPLYFALFTAGVLAPLQLSLNRFSSLRQVFRETPALACLTGAATASIAIVAVHFFSLAHPYLIADNRHYTFYIWKDIIQTHWSVKYLLIPLYIFCWWSIIHSLLENLRDAGVRTPLLQKLWVVSFCGAVIAVLVPAPLVEFRYFTVPFYLVALHSFAKLQVSSWKFWFVAMEFLAVNALTMRLFLWKPFHWAHEPGTQRFIW